jgi:hypothetical protein
MRNKNKSFFGSKTFKLCLFRLQILCKKLMFHEKNTKLGHAIQSIFHENNFVLFIDESLLLRK